MITFGYFNSVNGDRTYNADDMSNYFEGIVSDGIFKDVGQAFQVTKGDEPMSVKVGSGKAIIRNKWIRSTNAETLTIDSAEVGTLRYDAVILKCDLSNRQITLEIKKGNPGTGSPAMEDSAYIKEFCLAIVTVLYSATSITDSDILDMRASDDVCGYIKPLINKRIEKYESVYKVTGATGESRININISDYVMETDVLLVYINGLLAVETEDYMIGGTFIDLAKPLLAGNEVQFVVLKSVLV